MKVLILGKTGMLGSYIWRYFCYLINMGNKIELYSVNRDCLDVVKEFKNGTLDNSIRNILRKYEPNYVINCIGLTNKKGISPDPNTQGENITNFYIVNSYFPILFSDSCEERKIYFYHPSTDCIYSNTEKQFYPDCRNFDCSTSNYGLSKFLGDQISKNLFSTVIRSSIIGNTCGLENETDSLLTWCLKKYDEGEVLNGFINHTWNGITCLEFAERVWKRIEENSKNCENTETMIITSVFRNKTQITKYDLLKEILAVYRGSSETGRYEFDSKSETKFEIISGSCPESKSRIVPVSTSSKCIRDLRNWNFVSSDIGCLIRKMYDFDEDGRGALKTDSKFLINEENVIIITSAINSKNSAFGKEERFKQTISTIKSVRNYLQNQEKNISPIKIVLIEVTPFERDQERILSTLVDYCLVCDKKLQEKGNSLNKNIGELILMREVFKHLSENVKNIFKISGRYEIKESFDLSEFDLNKYNFRIGDDGECYHTTFYNIPGEEINNFRDCLEMSYDVVEKSETWLDIEHLYYQCIDKEKVNLVERLHVFGYYSCDRGKLYEG